MTVNSFHKKLVAGCGPERLGNGWVEKTRTECARNCLTKSYSYGNESTYAAYFNTYKQFADAEAACRCLGGHLFVAKTVAKFDLFRYIVSSTNYVWIGLNDIQVEGKFVWVDDGQEVDPVVKTIIFATNQPDNGGNSNCAYGAMWGGSFVLDDAPCDSLKQVVCEKPACT
ncbi:C-type lectin domain family 4 member M-like [Physella acuta]|uniref:C-type lectin domain family 4 member M-like n=1 Tax=Physella acuta TaxID=109671 RepID=UPI0027DE4E0A|nr:C-type lectin domain family 4 member M-like [Physella acuta]